MQITLEQAAALLGKTPRQIRYMIKNDRLRATKLAGRWMLDDSDLPVPPGKVAAHGRKSDRLHDAVSETLSRSGSPRSNQSMQQLKAFRALLPLHHELHSALGLEHPAVGASVEALRCLARGCHRFHRHEKADAYRHARDAVAEAALALFLEGSEEAAEHANQLEANVIPAISGLLARFDRRSNGR